MPYLTATFSEVMPMGMRQDLAAGLASTRGSMPPSHFMGLMDMVSTPAAMPTW